MPSGALIGYDLPVHRRGSEAALIAVHAAPPACLYGKERLHADAGLPDAAFMKPAEAVRLVMAEQLTRDVEVVWVRRVRWGKFAFARCSGVADDRLVYVVRLRFPKGFPFKYGLYDPGTLVDEAIDARTGERFVGHTMGNASCWSGPHGSQHPMSPACLARWRALTHQEPSRRPAS